MFLFDADDNQITLTDSLRFSSLHLDPAHITIVRTNKIGSEILFKTKKLSDSRLESKSLQTVHRLEQIKVGNQSTEFDEMKIRADKEFVITRPVKIEHFAGHILLPFLPAFA